MNEETTLLIKGTIAEMSWSDQKRVAECYAKIAALVNEYGTAGIMVIALIGSELLLQTSGGNLMESGRFSGSL